jgi:hypothetical protein
MNYTLKKIVKYIFITVTGTFLFFQISEAQEAKSAAVRQVLEKSGAREQIVELTNIVQVLIPSQMTAYDVPESSELSEYIINNLPNYYSGDEILGRIEKHFLINYNKNYINKVMNWYDTDLGKRIVEMEIAASTPEGAASIISYSYQLQLNPPEEKRMELIDELILLLELEKKSVEKLKTVFIRTIKGTNSSLPEDRRLGDDVIDFMTKSITRPFTEQIKTFLPATFLYTYQDISDDELGEYIDFLNQDYTKWFNDNLYDSMLSSIEDSAERFGADLGKRIAKLEPAKRENRQWKEHTVENTKFVIDLPGEPEFDSLNIPTELGIMTMNMLTVGFDEMAYLLMWVQDHPILTKKLMNSEDLLANAMMGSAMDVQGQVMEDNFIELDGHRGIEYKISFMSGQALMVCRVFIIDEDLVQIMTNGRIKDVIKKENDKFFNSFTVNK